MNRLLFITLFLSNVLTAQIKISGKIAGTQNKPIEFVEVALFSKQTLVKKQLADLNGDFALETVKGAYRLEIHQLNSILYSKELEINSNMELGTIEVTPVNSLDEVSITKKKERVERKIDRLVYNVENSISSVGGDALDALKMTPGLQVQNENVSIAGKSSVRVLINDRLVELREEDLAVFLKSIPADNIKSIEVITTPPAKYEALGNSGLVNIKLKKAKSDSWNITLGNAYLQRSTTDEESVTSNFLYSKNKLSMSASLNYREGATNFKQEDNIYFPDGLWNANNPLLRNYKRINGIASFQYQISPKWSIGMEYLTNINKLNSYALRNLNVYDYTTNEVTKHVKSEGLTTQNPNIHSINLFNDIKLDSIGKKITLNLDYFKYNNDDKRPYSGFSTDYDPYELQYFKGVNNNKQSIDNYSSKLDYEMPTELVNLNIGAKVSSSHTENEISQFNSGFTSVPTTDFPLTDSDFEYKENVLAAYIQGNKKMNDNLEVQLGVRLENTHTTANQNNLEAIKNKYFKLFPSFNLSYRVQESSIFRLNYSRRIQRPSFSQINPNITFINPFQTIEGNPYLKPAFIDNFEFIYSYKKLESKLYFSNEKGLFGQIAIPDSNTNYVRLTNQNNFDVKRYGITEIFTFSKFKWWTSNNVIDVNYTSSKSLNSIAEGRKGVNSKMSTNNDLTLNKDKTLLFNISYSYSFPETLGIIKFGSSSSTSLTIQYLLLNKDLKIALKGNDIFKTEKYRFNWTVNQTLQRSNYYFDNRYFQLSVNYKFGNKNVKVQKRKASNEEERVRTGN